MDRDLFARMEDVERLAELRRIARRAGHRGDAPTAAQASRLSGGGARSHPRRAPDGNGTSVPPPLVSSRRLLPPSVLGRTRRTHATVTGAS